MEEKKENFFELTVKAVIVNDKKEVLIVKRGQSSYHGAGKYDLPGGKLEAGENIKEGLVREIEEELGIKVELGPVIYAFDFEKKYDKKYKVGDKELIISGKGLRFLAYYESGEIKLSDEHDKSEWIGMDEAPKRFGEDDFEKDKKVAIKKAKEYLELKNYLDGWKRAQADFENYKKRQAENQKDLIRYAGENMILEILPVLDNFHASTEHIPEGQKENPWVTGIMHIQKQLEKILEDNGVAEIVIKSGDEFDPEIMEAIKSDANNANEHANDANNKKTYKVKKVAQKGYKIDGKVIRAARVIVE